MELKRCIFIIWGMCERSKQFQTDKIVRLGVYVEYKKDNLSSLYRHTYKLA